MKIFNKRQLSDSELVSLIIEGDRKAFEVLFLKYYPAILYFITGMLKDSAAAEDLAQSIFIRLWAGRQRLDPGRSVKQYLYMASRNEIINYFKSKYRSEEPISEELSQEPANDDIFHKIYYFERKREIERIVESMPEIRRKVFYLSRFEQKSNKEIAEMMKISVRTVEKHIQLALSELKSNIS